MDLISITGLVISIGQVVQVLFEYGSSVKSATRDTHSLVAELLAVHGVLELIDAQRRGGATKFNSDQNQPELTQLLATASESVASLQQQLGVDRQSGRVERLVQRAAWPFKQDDVRRQLGRLERVKMCLMMAMTSETMSQNHDLVSALVALRISFDEERNVSRQLRQNQEILDLLQWLSPTRPEEAHSRALVAHHPATSAWFEHGPLPQLLDLDTTVGRVMVIHGKSDILRKGVPYRALTKKKVDPLNILGAITGQLAVIVPELLEYLQSVLREDMRQRRQRSLTPLHLAAKLVEACRKCKLVFVLVDAINESAHCQRIQKMLFNLASKVPQSKDCGHQHCEPRKFLSNPSGLALSRRRYIKKARLGILGNPAFSALGDELKEELSRTIFDRTDGMFQVDHLSLQRTVRGVKAALHGMPFGLNEAYAAILRQVPSHSEDFKLLRRSLMWLSFASVPLHLNQLAEAATVEEGSTAPDPDNRLGNPAILLDLAQGLLSLDRATGVVMLAHSSVKTFLTSGWIHRAQQESGTGTTTVSAFALSPGPHVPERRRRHHHARRTSAVPAAARGSGHSPRGASYGWWIRAAEWGYMHEEDHLSTLGGQNIVWHHPHVAALVRTTPPLYYAASFGWADLVAAILKFDVGVDVDARGGLFGSTPLEVAAYRSHLAVVKILLQVGANPKALSNDDTCALDWVDKSWTDEELLELLRGGADAGQRVA
ncbi:hypothetical protein B0H14DRAFT_2608567 [Mycena olivaceomarginata]|nr:hypothetical protein B0H14DRAFT_2608567 [Mycena olivaceomarginata]